MPIAVAAYIEKLLVKKRWKAHYYFGPFGQKIGVPLKWILPQNFYENLMKKYNQLDWKFFGFSAPTKTINAIISKELTYIWLIKIQHPVMKKSLIAALVLTGIIFTQAQQVSSVSEIARMAKFSKVIDEINNGKQKIKYSDIQGIPYYTATFEDARVGDTSGLSLIHI